MAMTASTAMSDSRRPCEWELGMTTRNLIFGNTYRDSVVLMRLSRELTAIDGIEEATAIMGTDNNKALLEQAELLVETGQNAGANDVIVAFRVSSQDTETSVASRIRELLESERSAVDGAREYRPKTLNGALAALPGANLAVISVPGEYAAYEASKALDRGLHVFLFSNNVSVEDEVSLKNRALDLGLVMLGPDCGTAIINNAPIGFTNAVPEGRVGLVSASGTGLQQVTCLLAAGGEGVSQAWGVGSRDLDDRVGGLMMLHGLRTLENDPASELVVLISNPPRPGDTGTRPSRPGRLLQAVRRLLSGYGSRTAEYIQRVLRNHASRNRNQGARLAGRRAVTCPNSHSFQALSPSGGSWHQPGSWSQMHSRAVFGRHIVL